MPTALRDVPWDDGSWSVPPADVHRDGEHLLVTTRADSDLWRTTSYGFVHDDGHGLLAPLGDGDAVEVTFRAEFSAQFDQAGLLVMADDENWTKSGIELVDGVPMLGAVVTRTVSDWSTGPVPEWVGREVTIRTSRGGDALTIRARADGGPWRLVRVAPLDPERWWRAGPFACSPTSPGLTVRFTRWQHGPADAALHP